MHAGSLCVSLRVWQWGESRGCLGRGLQSCRVCREWGHSGEQVLVEERGHGDGSGDATGALRCQKKIPQDKMGLSKVCCSPKGN